MVYLIESLYDVRILCIVELLLFVEYMKDIGTEEYQKPFALSVQSKRYMAGLRGQNIFLMHSTSMK